MTNDTLKITRMEGEILPSALTLRDSSYMEDPQQVHSYPNAKFLDEIRVLNFIQSVLDKPEWRRKMDDDEIWKKWVDETRVQDPRFRDEMFDYARKELKWLAQSRDAETGIEPTGVDLVWRSDTLLPPDIQDRFLTLINQYEANIPSEKRDWHPNSDGKVLNLIHPSMFCLVYGTSVDYNGLPIPPPIPERTPVPYPNLQDFNGDNNAWYAVMQEHQKYRAGTFWSAKFQWLPAEFLIHKAGNVTIASYINSLLPVGDVNSGLYLVLAEIFGKAVPLLNVVLTDLEKHYLRNRFENDTYRWWPNWKPELTKELQEEEDAVYTWHPDMESDERERRRQEFKQKVYDWYGQQEMNKLPIRDFNQQDFVKVPLDSEDGEAIDLRGHQVQVIVKIGSIQLTPEKPTFDGGKWHVEGMANERIVATVIYYYDSENIAGDELRFRQAVELDYSDDRWEQGDDEGAKLVFGIESRGAMVQDAGRVKTPKGRVLCFPNMYQHQVPSFSLVDKTKPGHRKILVFFLVDPFVERGITSTASVPPQDIEEPLWRDAGVEEMMREKLPVELKEEIEDILSRRKNGNAKWGLTKEEALQNRLDLMSERSKNDKFVDGHVFGREFNLCEH